MSRSGRRAAVAAMALVLGVAAAPDAQAQAGDAAGQHAPGPVPAGPASEVPILFPGEVAFTPLYDEAGYFDGWMRHDRDWSPGFPLVLPEGELFPRHGVPWSDLQAGGVRSHLDRSEAWHEPIREDRNAVVRFFDGHARWLLGGIERQRYGSWNSQIHVREFHDRQGELFAHWERYAGDTRDVLAERPVHRDEFEPFFAEFQREYRRLLQFVQLMLDRHRRAEDCTFYAARGADEPRLGGVCGTGPIRAEQGHDASAFHVLSDFGSELFRAWGVDPWQHMHEIAATSRPTPLGARPVERIVLRFVQDSGEGFRPYAELVHGLPFHVEASIEPAPSQDRRVVSLAWEPARPAAGPGVVPGVVSGGPPERVGRSAEVTVTRTADAGVYRSGPLLLLPVAPDLEQEIEP